MRQQARTGKSLSAVAWSQPDGDRLVLKDMGIDKIDLVPWDASKIKYLSLDFNNIERLGGLGQFRNLVGVDLSNNNVSLAN
jgi:Leucine-rich repeat (LRR) protein